MQAAYSNKTSAIPPENNDTVFSKYYICSYKDTAAH